MGKILEILRKDADECYLKKDIERLKKGGKNDDEIAMFLYMDELQTRLSEVISLVSEIENDMYHSCDKNAQRIIGDAWDGTNKLFNKAGKYIDDKFYS